MFFGVHVEISFADEAFGVDEKGMARGKFGDAKIHERMVSGRDLMVCVREQPETQTFFRAKLLFKLPEVALKIVRFLGATTGEILGVEIEHDPFAAKIVQAERFAILRIQCEVRRESPRRWGFFSSAHSADYGDSNKQNDYRYEDPNHFHLAHPTLVLPARKKNRISLFADAASDKRAA